MPATFFDRQPQLEVIDRGSLLIPACGVCGLYKTCESPKMEPSGKGKKKILIVGEAPGADEDLQGRQFVGKAGRKLQEACDEAEIDPRKDCLITNSLICRPPSNRTPTKQEIGYCRANLLKTIREFEPNVIIPLGGPAIQSVLGYYYKTKQKLGGVMRWEGWQIPCQNGNVWICPTYHPSWLLRENHPIADKRFVRDLAVAGGIETRPWDTPPNFPARVETIINSKAASEAIQMFLGQGATPIAFDYETTCIKPIYAYRASPPVEGIICCSISDGKRTISYPWDKRTREATYELLRSDRPKIGANIKFEEAWTIAEFGKGVRNWAWDCCVDAHLIDNRPGISGLDFQAFVLLGMEDWSSEVAPYMKAREGTKFNRLRELDFSRLGRYNGLDSLIQYKVAKVQSEKLNMRIK